MLATLFLVFSGFYFLSIILIFIGLRRLQFKNGGNEPFISVVIAARNEAGRISPTLDSLTRLDYPQDRYEIIFVDDASEDNTADLIQTYSDSYPNWYLIRLQQKSSELQGKKKALQEAIKISKGEFIFTTDADCIVPPGWLRNMSDYFDTDTVMVLGHSPLKTARGFVGKFLKFDNLFSAIVAAAPLKLGFPHTSVGRNLSYKKDSYKQAGGYTALKGFRSGDDVHLTELFRKKRLGKIDYCIHPDTFIYTIPPSTTKEIFHQQIRKNSKTLKKSFSTIIFSAIVFIAFLLFMFLPLIQSPLLLLWIKVMAIKMIVEFIALVQAALIFRKKELIPWFPLMQVIYPFYVILFSLLGALQIYEWKK